MQQTVWRCDLLQINLRAETDPTQAALLAREPATLEPGCLPQSKQITDRFRHCLIFVWLYLRGDECLVLASGFGVVRRCNTLTKFNTKTVRLQRARPA